jgi:hypothetical protein
MLVILYHPEMRIYPAARETMDGGVSEHAGGARGYDDTKNTRKARRAHNNTEEIDNTSTQRD